MDALAALQIVLRRWKIVVPILILTAVAAVVVVRSIPDQYAAYGSAVVIDVPEDTAGQFSASYLAEALEDGKIRKRVRQEGGSGDYYVDALTNDIVQIGVETSQEAVAVRTVSHVLDEIEPTLNDQYEASDVPNEDRAVVKVLSRPQGGQPSPDGGGYLAEGSAQIIHDGGSLGEQAALSAGTAYSLLAEVLRSEPVIERLREEGLTSTYTVDQASDSATLRITAEGTDGQNVLDTVYGVMDVAREELAGLAALVGEEGSPPLVIQPLVEPTQPAVQSRGVLRSLAVIVFLGVVLAVGVAVLVERWSAIVAALRTARSSEPDVGPARGMRSGAETAYRPVTDNSHSGVPTPPASSTSGTTLNHGGGSSGARAGRIPARGGYGRSNPVRHDGPASRGSRR